MRFSTLLLWTPINDSLLCHCDSVAYPPSMKIGFWTFNIYLLLLAAFMPGCLSTDKRDKELSTFRMHIETNPDGTAQNGPVTIGRSEPFAVNVENAPFITEAHVENASVIDGLGGFQIMIQLNRQGTRLPGLKRFINVALSRCFSI